MTWREKSAEGWRLSDDAMEAFDRGDRQAATQLMDEANRLRAEALCEQPAPAPWIQGAPAARLRETR